VIDSHQLALFVPVIVVMVLLPGPDVLFVLAQSARGGARDGILAMLGITSAFFFVHVAGAALGISALIVKSVFLFSVLKYAGAAYLIYLGVKTLLKRKESGDFASSETSRRTSTRPFAQGFITNVLNPKVAIFMLAFLPQFVMLNHGSVAVQILELGAIWGVAGAIALSLVAFAGGSFALLRSRSERIQRLERYITGAIFVSLGLRVAIPDRR